METNVKLFYTNLIDTTPGTLTPSSEATEYPVENLFDNNYAVVWRSTAAGASAETIVCDFGSAKSIACVALGNINFRSTATVKIQGHTADSWGTPDVDETIVVTHLDGYVRSLYHDLASTYSKRYWRISVLDNGNPDGFIEIGEWFLGVSITLDDNYAAGNTKRLIRNNVKQITEFNQKFVYTRDWGWQFDLPWVNAQETTKEQLVAANQYLQGDATPFFLVLNDISPAEVYYVRMEGEVVENQVLLNVHSITLQFTEEMPGLIVPR